MDQRCVSVELTEKEKFKVHHTQVVSTSTPKSRPHFLPVVQSSSYLWRKYVTYTRVSKSSLHDSTHCASCSGLIMFCFVVKSNQTSLYDTIFNPHMEIHNQGFWNPLYLLPAPSQYFTICTSPWRPASSFVLFLSSSCDLNTQEDSDASWNFIIISPVLHPVCFPYVPSSMEPASSMQILLTACYSGSLGWYAIQCRSHAVLHCSLTVSFWCLQIVSNVLIRTF